jgi:putative oxidoreductase
LKPAVDEGISAGDMQTEIIRVLDWVVRLVAAGVLLQTLYFKFGGAPESVYIFSTLGAEPWGRLGSGVVELVAAALLLWSGTAALGGVLAAGVMTGAIMSHVVFLGIEVQGDAGLLFGLACLVLACSLATIAIHRAELRLA